MSWFFGKKKEKEEDKPKYISVTKRHNVKKAILKVYFVDGTTIRGQIVGVAENAFLSENEKGLSVGGPWFCVLGDEGSMGRWVLGQLTSATRCFNEAHAVRWEIIKGTIKDHEVEYIDFIEAENSDDKAVY